MSIKAIVSYDGTPNDQDALMLGRVLAEAGVELTLVYVRHSTLAEPAREQLEEHEAHALLERGGRWLGEVDSARRVVLSPSTPDGLLRVAFEENADLIVFGSDYRTAPGHVAPGRSAQQLLEGGPTAIAIAPAGYRDLVEPEIRSIGVLASRDDTAAADTAAALGERLGVTVGTSMRPDLLVVGSRPEAATGRVLVSAQSQYAIETSAAPVLVLARGAALTPRHLVAA